MKVGIVGLPLVGKSTIFNLLTHGHVDTSSWGGGKGEAHIGVARVPDARLERLAEIFHPEKATYATVEYVDLPGWERGEGRSAESRELGTYLNNLKNVDALLQVVRGFEDENIPHAEGCVDPARDIGIFELEMMVSDLAIIERRLERLSKDLKKGRSPELELEHGLLERFREALEREQPLRDMELTEDEQRRVRGYTFLSAKPLLLVINLGDEDVARIPRVVQEYGLEARAAQKRIAVTAVCGKIESEMTLLSEEDARLFRDDLGLGGSGLDRIIHESYALLGLFSFYTAGDPEVRAWTIPKHTNAHQAAGAIHTDFARGFIKAEVVSYDDMLAFGSFQAAKSRGALRLEGKDYIVKEGDVILFRFNI